MLREIKIESVLNGWIVEVGCQKVVFTELTHMMIELKRYLNDPEVVEKVYLKNSVNSEKLGVSSGWVHRHNHGDRHRVDADGDVVSVPLSELHPDIALAGG